MHLTCRFMWGFFLQKKKTSKQTKNFNYTNKRKKKHVNFPFPYSLIFYTMENTGSVNWISFLE